MSERLTLVSPRIPQLECVNQKVTDLSARQPYGDVVELFALAAYLASEADLFRCLDQLNEAFYRSVDDPRQFLYLQ